MVEPLRHRQTKGAATDMPGLPPPRHIPTLPISAVRFTEGSVDAPTPPVNLYNQKSQVLPLRPQCAVSEPR